MIQVRFYTDREQLTGFRISGHAGAAAAGEDIVCAAVSSAAYMTANTITDILLVPAHITVDDGLMELRLCEGVAASQTVLKGLRLHLQALQEEYPNRVHLMNTEV
ncbi:MAG: ribosomal-processing cysteine protease Prp [Clostridia bacterium]|nr:ribosomal-processing cysteine protease Prp [Clostridia bacterium]